MLQSQGEADQTVYDTLRRICENLRVFDDKAVIHAAAPRVACSGYGKTGQLTGSQGAQQQRVQSIALRLWDRTHSKA
ncbi:MAG: hypothetical protein MK098_09365 [Marinovum sp.]|nr:hypothetical protein [Marinovum sp.]